MERKRKNDLTRGFTLIEVMVALAVLATVLVAVSSMSVATMRANRRARQVTAATNLARDKIEELRGTAYWTLSDGADLDPVTEAGTTGGAAAIYYRSWFVWAGPSDTTLRIKVVVQWIDAGTQEVVFRTMVGA